MTTGNLPSTTTGDVTTQYFNNFSTGQYSITSNANDALIAYFEQMTGDVTSGRVLASAVIQTAYQQGLDPMETLDQFRKMPAGELNAYLVLFLNLSRAPTSLLGINNQTQTSPYVMRTILP